jgi:hypothetical protein
MSDTTNAPDLASQYTAQVAGDLEHNVKEQKRISAEITALQEQLAALQRDHRVLVNMQQALGKAPSPAPSPAVTPDSAAVPSPRGKAGAKAGPATGVQEHPTTDGRAAVRKPAVRKPAGNKSPGKPAGRPATKSAAGTPAAKSAAGTPAAKTTAKKTAKKTDQPTLVELVRRHLAEQREPRSAAEITTALAQAHPDRGIKNTVVRTTLEGLVARNHAQRTKQGTSVFYTATEAPEQTAAPEDQPQPESASA